MKWISFLVCFYSLGLASPSIGEETAVDLKSNGSTSTRKILPYFNAIHLGGIGDLHIEQSTEESLVVEAPDNLLSLVKVTVRDKVLYLDLIDASQHTQSKINYYLNIRDLNTITSSSSSTVYIENGFQGDTLNLELSNLGQAVLKKIHLNKLQAKLEGGVKLSMEGRADDQKIQIVGAGQFEGAKLLGKTATFEISGNGLGTVNAALNLSLKIPNEGKVQFCGKPILHQSLSKQAIVGPLDLKDCSI